MSKPMSVGEPFEEEEKEAEEDGENRGLLNFHM